ncbi:MAG: hypothetical protein H7Z37_16960, partial [Pyrinomonadaceae bacterium]|nr:hypothetical protein [Pyrinomonadaceae bacterium]
PQLLITNAKIKINDNHTLSFNTSGASLGDIETDNLKTNGLGLISVQAIDEWQLNNGILVVFGVDYARFVGASNAKSINPRIGLQFDANARTRINAGYTTRTEQKTWQQVAELESGNVSFRQNILEPLAVVDKKIVLPKLRRIEFGFERVLDNSSSIETTIFLDSISNRGLNVVTFANFNPIENGNNLFANELQNGSSQGVRVVYARRLNKVFSTTLGYAFGRGQELSQSGVTNPKELLENSFFQTFTAQVSADFRAGTKINAVYRVAPRNAVLAIDPFGGRLNNYAPSVSILVTQNLPTMGLPIRAKAVFDAQNLLDWQAQVNDGTNSLKIDSARRTLRGGIAVRF